MHCLNRCLECTIPEFGRFQYEESFLCLDDFSFPTINRLNSWHDTRAGSQLRIHHFFANPYCFFLIYRRDQDNKDVPC